jgi:hypothetical protein
VAAVLVGRGEEIGKSELALRAATHSAEATVSFSLSLLSADRTKTNRSRKRPGVSETPRDNLRKEVFIFFSMEHKNFIF